MSKNITFVKGDLLKPETAESNKKRIIIHSCNCEGSWGGGIALQLGQKYPKSELEYTKICDYFSTAGESQKLLGNFVIIPSFQDSKVLVACLFTSLNHGERHDSEESILENTKKSLNKLVTYIANGKKFCPPPTSPSKKETIIESKISKQRYNPGDNENDDNQEGLKLLLELMNEEYFSQFNEISDLKNFELQMPKINSGIFGVPWEKTENIINELPYEFTVYTL